MVAEEGKSLAETPTWAVATVITVMVVVGFSINGALERIGKWLERTKSKSLSAALDKIKDELMLFAVLSLLMGHWIIYAAKICVKSSESAQFIPCTLEKSFVDPINHQESSLVHNYRNYSFLSREHNQFCNEGSVSFASKEGLEQLHRFLFVLGVMHVAYSFLAVALALIKIYSWRNWENQAKSMDQDSRNGSSNGLEMRRATTFIYHHTTHPWSQHNVLVWLLCFSRQFWSSINRADYKALRLGFITTHKLPLSYDFHNYMIRSMDEEFQDIIGISIPLWIFAIACILLGFHGTDIYFWLSFLPAIFICVVGAKLHRVVIKLAVETMHMNQMTEFHQFNLRNELFWFGRPMLLLRLIQFINFQNAFEMATCIWSLWEVHETSCFTKSHSFLAIRLTFGLVSQCWCSFITFPLYVIVAQMGSQFKKTIVSETVRESLHKWRRRVRARRGDGPSFTLLKETASATSLDSMLDDDGNEIEATTSRTMERCSSRNADMSISNGDGACLEKGQSQTHEFSTDEEKVYLVTVVPSPPDDTCHDHDGYDQEKDGSYVPTSIVLKPGSDPAVRPVEPGTGRDTEPG